MAEHNLYETYEAQDSRTLKGCLYRYKGQVMEKQALMDSRQPGTSQHTSAKHNLETYQRHIYVIEQILSER